eukprot:CAMPEP_0197584160 /NCGR_PEP_ID=MMETSP1326-20131121/6855_1 /TAXON_ID=1155430 /ORGANISM="Genus nov. species nov., Strain RCC2288" /LENGTH=1010 /DNA_ID=CAMNT_0043148485 /DNA_START=142 /DNA_END=3170 /DNA_ORIENTATION=-
MASTSAVSSFTAQTRIGAGSTRVGAQSSSFAPTRIAPLQRRAAGFNQIGRSGSRRAQTVEARAASSYTSQQSSGREMGGPRDLYEGTTGLDVLAMQKDLVAEGYLSPSEASGVFTPNTRASIEVMQQQYGLPINGVWGSLERQVFDSARGVSTSTSAAAVYQTPPPSAQSLLPPTYNSAPPVYTASVAPAPALPAPVARHVAAAGEASPVGEFFRAAAFGFATAAAITKADRIRQEMDAEGKIPSARGGGGGAVRFTGTSRRFFEEAWDAITAVTGAGNKKSSPRRAGGGGGGGGKEWYNNNNNNNNGPAAAPGYGTFEDDVAPPRRPQSPPQGDRKGAIRVGNHPAVQQQQQQQQQQQWQQQQQQPQQGSKGSRWFTAQGATVPDSYDAFPGGYPVAPPTSPESGESSGRWGGPAAHPPVRPGDLRKPKQGPGGGGGNTQSPTQQQQGGGGWQQGGGNTYDNATPSRDYVISSSDIAGAARPGGSGTSSVPPYGGSGGGGYSSSGGGRRTGGSGPASVPEYGGANSRRMNRSTDLSSPPQQQQRGGGGFTGASASVGGDGLAAMAMAGDSGGVAVAPAPPRPSTGGGSKYPEPPSAVDILRNVASGLGDGLRALATSPDSAVRLRDSSDFTVHAQRERELQAQVEEARQYADIEHKKRLQLETAYAATRSALTEAEAARRGLRLQEEVSTEMQRKMEQLERALNQRDILAAVGVFGSGGEGGSEGANIITAAVNTLHDRVSALEAAQSGADGATAAAAMLAVQQKVMLLERAMAERVDSASKAAASAARVDALAAQIAAITEQQTTQEMSYWSVVSSNDSKGGGNAGSGAALSKMAARVMALEKTVAGAVRDATTGVPELRKQVLALRAALKEATGVETTAGATGGAAVAGVVRSGLAGLLNKNKTAGSVSATSSTAASAASASDRLLSLERMDERMAKLEELLKAGGGGSAASEKDVLSLDVLYAKVGVVEEGLAAAANGSANLIAELQQQISHLGVVPSSAATAAAA